MAFRTYLEHLQSVSPQVIPITALHIVYSDKQAIIHNIHPLQKFGVAFELFRQEGTFLWAELYDFVTIDPIQIFEDSSGILSRLCFGVFSSDRAPLEIVRFVNITMWWEKIVHDDKMDFVPMG